ncbi:MAG TPA: sulfite exporter TauE/SafE family protein [Candidatus Methanomethylophilaceae archaeon]|nr:sulfite exporter TauE/SafE family protein [Candidatus Methanomethylophilaceae archaeon]
MILPIEIAMDPILLISLMLVGLIAGVMGALFGIGGGMIIVPILTILFGLAAKEAVAISLVGIVATSVGASSVYVKKRVSNIHLGLLLEVTTVFGAILGVFIASYLSNFAMTAIFSIVLIFTAIKMIADPKRTIEPSKEPGAYRFTYYDEVKEKDIRYDIQNAEKGVAMCTLAGVISSMTGMGGGAIKVPIMNMYMGVPMKAATATSNYMIGITAFVGAILYFIMGEISLTFAGAVAVGGFVGSMIGTKVSSYIDGKSLRKYFSILLFFISAIMLLNAGGYL